MHKTFFVKKKKLNSENEHKQWPEKNGVTSIIWSGLVF